jgi:hypothetical protein
MMHFQYKYRKAYLITEYHSALIKYCIVKILFPAQRKFDRIHHYNMNNQRKKRESNSIASNFGGSIYAQYRPDE